MTDTGFYCPASKLERFALLYGRNLEPVAASQPGTSGPFTFETAPKLLSGGGGLVSTGIDYIRFCLMLSGMGQLEGARLLKEETITATPFSPPSGPAQRLAQGPTPKAIS